MRASHKAAEVVAAPIVGPLMAAMIGWGREGEGERGGGEREREKGRRLERRGGKKERGKNLGEG